MEMGSPNESFNTKVWRRQVRLRAACNQCHTAKVRCSGEKTGCTRCQRLHQDCLYSISQIGRGSGILDKNKRFKDAQDQRPFSQPRNSKDSNATPMSDVVDHGQVLTPLPDGSSIGCVNAENPEHDALQQIGLPWDYLDLCGEFPDAQLTSLNFDASDVTSYPSTLANSMLLTPHGNEYESTRSSSTAASPYIQTSTGECPTPPQVHEDSPSHKATEPRPSTFHRCITSCSKLIEYIAAESPATPRPLDHVMEINHVALCEIGRIRDDLGEDWRTSVACSMLVHAALDALVALFESSVRAAARMPRLRLGSFRLASGPRAAAFTSQCVVAEVRRTGHAVEALSGDWAAVPSALAGALRCWSGDVMRRLTDVMKAVEEVP